MMELFLNLLNLLRYSNPKITSNLLLAMSSKDSNRRMRIDFWMRFYFRLDY